MEARAQAEPNKFGLETGLTLFIRDNFFNLFQYQKFAFLFQDKCFFVSGKLSPQLKHRNSAVSTLFKYDYLYNTAVSKFV